MKLDIDDAEEFRGDVKVVAVEDLRALLEKEEKQAKEHFTPQACDGLFYLTGKLLAELSEAEGK